MEIKIDFGHPFFEEETIFEMDTNDLDNFYHEENEVNQMNLFFVLEASLHRFQSENKMNAAARCSFLMAYYLFTPLTPPASFELAEFYMDRALEWNETPEYREWKNFIDKGN